MLHSGFSILEDAGYPSFFNFYLEAWRKRLFWVQRKMQVAIGCILILQAVHFQAKEDLPYSDAPPPPLYKAVKGRFNPCLR